MCASPFLEVLLALQLLHRRAGGPGAERVRVENAVEHVWKKKKILGYFRSSQQHYFFVF